MVNARKLAVNALCRVEEDGAYSNLVLNEILSNAKIEERDKSLLSALFYGVLDRRLTIDYYLNRLSKVKVRKMQPITKSALRIGIYQVVYMDKIPNSAAVNESVNIVKNSSERRNSGFVNAVLRAAVRQLPELPKLSSAKDISVVYSCPEDIVKELINDYGKNVALEILESFLNPADIYIRVNSTKISKADFIEKLKSLDIEFEEALLEDTFKIVNSSDIFNSQLYKDGLFFVQDISAGKCAAALKASKGQRLLDVCASPGGKSFAAAIDMQNQGEIVSCDLYEQRVALIKGGADRLSLSCIKPTLNDASVYNEELGKFDSVICDVPCSGWGVMRRKPEIKYKGDKDFSELEALQRRILLVSSRYVKTGGTIVYSTCTLRKKENELQISDFLKNNPNFSLVSQETILSTSGYDGFYYSVIKKE